MPVPWNVETWMTCTYTVYVCIFLMSRSFFLFILNQWLDWSTFIKMHNDINVEANKRSYFTYLYWCSDIPLCFILVMRSLPAYVLLCVFCIWGNFLMYLVGAWRYFPLGRLPLWTAWKGRYRKRGWKRITYKIIPRITNIHSGKLHGLSWINFDTGKCKDI